jgi:hypothetical protein
MLGSPFAALVLWTGMLLWQTVQSFSTVAKRPAIRSSNSRFKQKKVQAMSSGPLLGGCWKLDVEIASITVSLPKFLFQGF